MKTKRKIGHGLKILAIAKLHHAFANHYGPLADSQHVSAVTALRPDKWTKSVLSNIEVIDYQHWPLPISLFLILISAIRKIRADQHDAIVAFSPIPYGLIAILTGKATGRPVHIGVIGEDISQQPKWLLEPLARYALGKAQTISVVGSKTRKRLASLLPDRSRIFVLPHGVTADFYPEPGTEKTHDALFVGDLLPLKRVDFIIRTWYRVVMLRPGSKLCIVGDGPQRNNLEALTHSLGLGGNIDFAGSRKDVADFYRKSDLLIMASETEGLPYVLVEAMACGTIPVVNDVGDIASLITHGKNGVLLEKWATEAEYTVRILELLERPSTIQRLRTEVLHSVKHLKSATVTGAWNRILSRLVDLGR